MSREKAAKELEKGAGEQFDPRVIQVLVEVLMSWRRGPPGRSERI